jgi:hypothetical protein
MKADAAAGVLELPLRGPKGEPVDFARTIVSHGVAELPPNRIDRRARVVRARRGPYAASADGVRGRREDDQNVHTNSGAEAVLATRCQRLSP